jgi:manganese-dependent inorganic pyrophosphatase
MGCITSGQVCVGTSPKVMANVVKPGDTVLVTNRYKA